MNGERGERGFYAALALLAVLCAASTLWRLGGLDGYAWDYDEGAHAMAAMLVGRGYSLYREVFNVQPPLLIWVLLLAFGLGGRTFAAARVSMVLVSTLSLAGIGLYSASASESRTEGVVAGLLGVGILSAAPEFFYRSRMVGCDVGAISLAVVSMGFLALYLRSRGRRWLFFAGLLMSLSLLMKLLTIYLLALPLAAIARSRFGDFSARESMGDAARDVAALGAGLLLPGAVVSLFVYLPAFYRYNVELRVMAREAYSLDVAQNARGLLDTLWQNRGIALLAAYGLFAYRREFGRGLWLAAAWLVLAFAMLLTHTPLRQQHFLLILPPLAILAGFGLVGVYRSVRRARVSGAVGVLCALVGLAALGVYGAQAGEIAAAIGSVARAPQAGREDAAAAFLREIVPPDGYVMTDEPALAFVAGRMVPPPVADPSLLVLRSGYLGADAAREITLSYRPDAVALWSGRFAARLPEYVDALREGDLYAAEKYYDDSHRILFAPRLEDVPESARRVFFALDDGISLVGCSRGEASKPGDTLDVILYWHASKTPGRAYTVFVQLLDAGGSLRAGQDSQPFSGHLPTGSWPPGVTLRDFHALPLPPDLPPGDYSLITGMYDPESGARLPVGGDGDFAPLGTVRIQ